MYIYIYMHLYFFRDIVLRPLGWETRTPGPAPASGAASRATSGQGQKMIRFYEFHQK